MISTASGGEDKFGKFAFRAHAAMGCDVCGKSVSARLHYMKDFKLPEGIDVKATVLKNHALTWIGITCGCYAKLHRQVAHIEDAMKTRAPKDTSGEPSVPRHWEDDFIEPEDR